MKHSNTWFALILIASVLLLSAGKKGANAQQLPREHPAYPAEQNVGSQQYSGAIKQRRDKGSINNPIRGVQAEQDGNGKDDSADGHQQSDWWMVKLTAVLAVITFFQLCTFWVQYRAMVFSERAQIIVIPTPTAPPPRLVVSVGPNVPATTATPPSATTPVQPFAPDGLKVFGVGQNAQFQGTILNVGKTPAFKVSSECWMELIAPPFKDFPSNAVAAKALAAQTVYPNGPSAPTFGVRTDHPMSQIDFDEFVHGQRELWIRVRITYRDLFRKSRFRRRRFAEFGWKYSNVGLGVLEKYQDSN